MVLHFTNLWKASYDAGRSAAASGQPIPKELLVDRVMPELLRYGGVENILEKDMYREEPKYPNYFPEARGQRTLGVTLDLSRHRDNYLKGYADEIRARIGQSGNITDAVTINLALLLLGFSPDLTSYNRGFNLEERASSGVSLTTERLSFDERIFEKTERRGTDEQLYELGIMAKIAVQYGRALTTTELHAVASHLGQFKRGLAGEREQTSGTYGEILDQISATKRRMQSGDFGRGPINESTLEPKDREIDFYKNLLRREEIIFSPKTYTLRLIEDRQALAYRIGQELKAVGPIQLISSSNSQSHAQE